MLKYVRGDPLSADHWLELFRLLKMPKGTTLEKLTFGNILDSAEEITAKRDELKVSSVSSVYVTLYLAGV